MASETWVEARPLARKKIDPRAFGEAVAEDATMLAVLHDRELAASLIDLLRHLNFPFCLGLMPLGSSAEVAWQAMADAVRLLPRDEALDDLRADYAEIYLTGALGASPCESVWTDDDRLMCQESMFEMRGIYKANGYRATDWRQRADDHLVVQLLYVAAVARCASSREDWTGLARVLDQHLLRWLPRFATCVVLRSGSSFYAGLALLTEEWSSTLRDNIAVLTGEARPALALAETRQPPASPDMVVPVSFMPGIGPTL